MRCGVAYANTFYNRDIPTDVTHSKAHRLNNLAWNLACYAENFHETSNFLSDAAFFNTVKRKFSVNSTVCLYYKFQSVNAEKQSNRCPFSVSNEIDKQPLSEVILVAF